MTEHHDPGMIEHAPSCHLQHGLGGRCTCGASDRALVDSPTFSTPRPRLAESQHDAPPMTHADALGAYDDPMPPDLPDRVIDAVREEVEGFRAAGVSFPSSRLGRGLGALIPDGTPLRPFGEGVTVRQGDEVPDPAALADAAQRAEEFADRAESRIWAWLNRHNAPWSPSDAKVRDLAYDLGTIAAPISIPTPRLDAARRKEFDRSQLAELIDGAGAEAMRALHAKIAEEDARARALLPDAPPGWEWEASLQPEAIGAAVLGEVIVKIVYRLREVPL